VIIGQEEVYEQLDVYRSADRDEHDFDRRLNSSWNNMKNKLRVIHQAGAEDRAEISPVLRLIVDAEQVSAISAEYQRIAAGEAPTQHEHEDETSLESADDEGLTS